MKIKKCMQIQNIDVILDYLIAIALVISPILQHYTGPIINAGYTVLVVGIPFIMLKAFMKFQNISINKDALIAYLLVAAYFLYHVVDHGFSIGAFAKFLVLFAYLFSITSNLVSIKTVVKIATIIAMINVACLIAQYICFYIFRYKLQFVDSTKLLESSYRWVKRVSTSSVSDTFYRPSGLFLEPSHVFLYTFPVVLFHLFGKESNKKSHFMSAVIILGLLLSTSGMGIVFSTACIAIYVVLYKNPKYKKGSFINLLTPKALILFCASVIILVVLYNNVDIVYRSIVRIISIDYKGYNAIDGRTEKGAELLKSLEGIQYLFGVSDVMGELGTNLSGFQGELWKYGTIGILLSYGYYVFCAIKSKDINYFYMCIVLMCISFFCGHTHREFYLLYFSAYIITGTQSNKIKNTQI